ncbi:MAG: ABC transporter substrate-binding protein [Pelolinea sp.]|nr:ABC transporter substrate-binding protein [Pelolinea sp.]
MNKKFTKIFGLLLVFGVLLAACGPKAPAATEEATTAAPAEEKTCKEVSVWDTGFKFGLGYNLGNDTRRSVAELLASSVNEVNEIFEISVTGIPWATHLRYQRANLYPIHTTGWQEDYHDPHNWYPTYLYGTFGSYLNMPEEKVAEFKALVDAGVAESDFDKRGVIYAKLDQMIYDYAPYILGALPSGRHYEQTSVEGYYYNPIASGFYFYPLSKTAAAKNPTTMTELTIGEPETLDPALAYETAGGEIIDNVYEGLIQYDREKPSTFVPALAAEMPTISDDGTVYTFKVRDGVTFQNGNDLTPSDVAYSLQRGLLQGFEWVSPQWMIWEAFFDGVTDPYYLVDDQVRDTPEAMLEADPAALAAVCEQVKAVIVADDAAGTVTMTLPRPWPLMPILAGAWGSVMDQDWVIENGGWDGSCDTWQNFYAPSSESHVFSEIMNGTGPFALESWDHATQTITLVRNENYWRNEETGPAWEGGPVGPAALERVVVSGIDEWGTRFATFKAGDGDFIGVDKQYQTQVDAFVGEYYQWDAAADKHLQSTLDVFQEYLVGIGSPTTVGDGTGPFRLFNGHSGLSRTDVFINELIANPEDGGNVFIGSGNGDGNGIPTDFFANEHVRKAFNYCFDWDTYIADVLSGEAVQAVSTELPGMPGFDPNAPHYTYDLEKCAEEFKLATMMVCE